MRTRNNSSRREKALQLFITKIVSTKATQGPCLSTPIATSLTRAKNSSSYKKEAQI